MACGSKETGGGVYRPRCPQQSPFYQTEVIEKILRHCGLWEESPARSPPAAAERLKA